MQQTQTLTAANEIPRLLQELRDHIVRKTGKPIDPDVDFLTCQIEMLSATGPMIQSLREEYAFTPKERRLFNHLDSRIGVLFSRQALYNVLYFDYVSEDEPDIKILDVYVTKMRAKLIKADAPHWIETVYGEGYRLVNKRARDEVGKTSNGQPRRFGRKIGVR